LAFWAYGAFTSLEIAFMTGHFIRSTDVNAGSVLHQLIARPCVSMSRGTIIVPEVDPLSTFVRMVKENLLVIEQSKRKIRGRGSNN